MKVLITVFTILASVTSLANNTHPLVGSWERVSEECLQSEKKVENTPIVLEFTEKHSYVGSKYVGDINVYPLGEKGLSGNFTNKVGEWTYYYTYVISKDGSEMTLTQVENYQKNKCGNGEYLKSTFKSL